MNIIDISTMTQTTLDDLRNRNPLVSFPEQPSTSDLLQFNFAPITYTPAPVSEYGYYTQNGYQQNADGTYSVKWAESFLPLNQAQDVILAKVADYRRNIAYKPVVYNGVQVPVNSDVITILQVVISGTITINFKGDDGWLSVAPSDATALINQIQTQVQAAFTNEKKHHDSIMSLTTVDQIVSYDYTTGW